MDWKLSIIILLSLGLAVSTYYLAKFSLIILRIQDAIEESLDVIDERYQSISKILEIPLFYDSPQIRQVVNDIKITRDSLLKVAKRFATVSVDETDDQQEDVSNDKKN
jgi:hypothetical protein